MRNYKTSKLEIEYQEEHKASWRFAAKTVKGTEYIYKVNDANFRSFNSWIFAVRVPADAYGDIIIQPSQTPGKKVWAELDRRAVVLTRATRQYFKSRVYCKLNLADPSGWQTKKGTHRGDRNSLPKWFQAFRWRMRLKETVTTTRGSDGRAQIILMERDDYSTMIKLYFALKVWVLQEHFSITRD